MPSDDLLLHFQRDVRLVGIGAGGHALRPHRRGLAGEPQPDRHRPEVGAVLAETYGASEAKRFLYYWRTFFLSCAELWGSRAGSECTFSTTCSRGDDAPRVRPAPGIP